MIADNHWQLILKIEEYAFIIFDLKIDSQHPNLYLDFGMNKVAFTNL